jgi:hypothetical protein
MRILLALIFSLFAINAFAQSQLAPGQVWGNPKAVQSPPSAANVVSPLVLDSSGLRCPTCAASGSGQPLTKTDDTNVTLTLGGSSSIALVNPASLTLGWSGVLAAARLNSNVVQVVTNDTNIIGSISAQNLTLGWSGVLAAARGGTGISSLGTGIATFLGTPSSANLRAALTDETGTGLAYFQGGALGTPSSGTLTNTTGLPLTTGVTGNLPFANFPVGVSDTAIGYWGSTTASALAVNNCSNALTYSTSTHTFGCSTNGTYQSSIVAFGSGVALTNNVAKDVTLLSLTAGDWDCSGSVGFQPAGTTTVSGLQGFISTVSNTSPSAFADNIGFAVLTASLTTGQVQILTVPTTRFNIGSTTTIYLGALASFGVSTMNAPGMLRCRKVG